MSDQLSDIQANPFAVKTPENLSAKELVDLFVPYPEFDNLQVSGHQFLDGHRGSGKSMMLRMMSPDSQELYRKLSLFNLPYFGVYLSIKATELNAPEYSRLINEPSGTILSEHVLTTKLLSALFLAIKAHCIPRIKSQRATLALQKVIIEIFFNNLRYAGWRESLPDKNNKNLEFTASMLEHVIRLVDEIQSATVQYIKRRSFVETRAPYQGALLGFQDMLLPLVKAFAAAKIIPSPVYFLLDDADNLNLQQTQILNTWVSYRSTELISLKISTQLNYKTLSTTSGTTIEAPHDFSSINFTSVQTGSAKDRYPELVEKIVRKRLKMHKAKNCDPYVFFPEDKKQEEEIQKIYQKYKKNWKKGKGGYRANDDAYRFARPEYIRRLGGISKQASQYHYAGFEQLVHISSGIIRFFLEPASRMYTEQSQANKGQPVLHILPTIQDSVLRKQADQLLIQSFDELQNEARLDSAGPAKLKDVQRLQNIVMGIGALFRAHIMDPEATQRRVFSFSISGDAAADIKSILKLGEIHGYFYASTIGAKSGLGRKTLYVLTRRLAPAFALDPNGFSGYLTVKNTLLQKISLDPQAYIGRLKSGLANVKNDKQLTFWEGKNE